MNNKQNQVEFYGLWDNTNDVLKLDYCARSEDGVISKLAAAVGFKEARDRIYKYKCYSIVSLSANLEFVGDEV